MTGGTITGGRTGIGVNILTYHSISEGPAPLCIAPSVFATTSQS